MGGAVYVVDNVPAYVRGLLTMLREDGYDCTSMCIDEAHAILRDTPPTPAHCRGTQHPVVVILVIRDRMMLQLIRSVSPNLDRFRGVALISGDQPSVAPDVARESWIRGIYASTVSNDELDAAIRHALQGFYGGAPSLVSILPVTTSSIHGLTGAEVRWLSALAAGRKISALADAEGWSEREMYRRLRACTRRLELSRGRTPFPCLRGKWRTICQT